MGGAVAASKAREGEARDKVGACEKLESTAVEEAVNVGVLAGLEGGSQECRMGGRATWIGLALT